MKLILDKNKLNQTTPQLLRSLGYSFLADRKTRQESFVRSLGRSFYPRFHLYIKEENDKIIFNLHLDQKRPSYTGSHAHNAEFVGEVMKNEIKRIKSLIEKGRKGWEEVRKDSKRLSNYE